MEQRILGNTGLKVSRLGAGLAEIGYEWETQFGCAPLRRLHTAWTAS
jgi:aryl-alcohol dehydrogenase-like predicted oxidoreductase